MRREVLADTGPLYAAADPGDALHERAQVELRRIEASHWSTVVIYPVLLEAYTLVLRRLGLPAARTWLRDVASGASLLNPTPDDYHSAMQLVPHYPDQPLTLVDAVAAVVAHRLKIPVWTYDHHFDLMRASVWRP